MKRYSVNKDDLCEPEVVEGLSGYVDMVILDDIKDSLIVWHNLEKNPDDLPPAYIIMVLIRDKKNVWCGYWNGHLWYELLRQEELKNIIEWAYLPKSLKE